MENNIFLETIWLPGDVREIRILSKDGKTFSGYFDNPGSARLWVEKYEKNCFVYTTLNPVHPGLMARCSNKIKMCGKRDSTTSDNDIVSLNFLLVDLDPKRPSGISSSDQEKAIAKEVAEKVGATLGNPLIYGDSGNGYHLIYRCHTANANDTKAFLAELNKQYGNEFVDVDIKVFNPSRITKVLGTWAIKGENTPDRPWRKSCVIETCQSSQTIEIPAIPVAIAKSYTKNSNASQPVSQPFDARKFLSDHGIIVKQEKQWNDCTMLVLESCVFDPSHKGKDASVLVHPDGKLSYQCFHSSCSGKTWADLRGAVGDPKKDIGGVFKTCDSCGKEIKLVQDAVGKWAAMEVDAVTKHSCRKRKAATRQAIVEEPKNYGTVQKEYSRGGKTFSVTDTGLYLTIQTEKGPHETKICAQSPVIKDVLRDLMTDKVSVVVSWGTHEVTVPLEVIQFTKEISKLTESGLFVNSLNAKSVIEYFSIALEDHLYEKPISSMNGWNGKKFVLGESLIEEGKVSAIEFEGKAYIPSASGTKEAWLGLVERFVDDPGMAIRLGMSAISPALKILGCNSFINHYWGCSTSGKTISSYLACSLWGKPSLLIEAWKQSLAGKETYFEEAGGLPVFLEESHKSAPGDLEETVYAFCNEKGKGRATIRHGEIKRQKSKTWFGCCLSTGESKITDKSQMAGVEARIVEFQREKPENNQAKAKELNQIKNALDVHFGWLGIPIIQFVQLHAEQLKKTYLVNFDMLNAKTTNNLQSRQIGYLAAALTGIAMLSDLGVKLCPITNVFEKMVAFLNEEPPKTTAQKAIDAISDLVQANICKFETTAVNDAISPAEDKTTWGKISYDGKTVDFIPSILVEQLKLRGFEESVLFLLREDNKIIHEKGRLTKQSRIAGRKSWAISVLLD